MGFTSRLTGQSQTTLPAAVRRLLQLEPGDKLGYLVEGDKVLLVNATREAEEETDPVIESFLPFLARDLETHADALEAVPAWLLTRARDLLERGAIDHNRPIDGAIDL